MVQNHFGKEFTSEDFKHVSYSRKDTGYEKLSSQSKILLWGELHGGAKNHQHPY